MKNIAATLLLSLVLCAPAYAQGLGEMGGAYAMPKGAGMMGGLQNAVGNLYGRAGIPPAGGARGGRSGVVGGVASPAARLDSDQLAAYTASANKSYLAALAAMKAGKKDVAIREFSSALTVRERLWGSADPAVADIARRLAELYSAQGKTKEAADCWRKVLASEQRQFGSDSPKLAKTLSTLASLCEKNGEARDAAAYFRQLYGIQRKGLAANAPDPAPARATRLKLATALTLAGDFRSAEALLKDGVTAESDSAYQADLYSAYGALMREMGRDTDALAMESKAASLRGTAAPAPSQPTAAEASPATLVAPVTPSAQPGAPPATAPGSSPEPSAPAKP